MAVITSQILDISSTSPVTYRQWANNTNKLVVDVNSVNTALVPLAANVVTLKTTTTRLSANVVTINTTLAGLGSSVASPNLQAVAALAVNGLITKTSANTVSARTIVAPASGVTISNGDGVAGNPTLALANDLSAIEALASTGFAVRTAADTWAQRTLAAPAAGITISNATGVAGNPTFALANDLAALESFVSTGFAVRTATDTWSQRSILAPSTGVTISNGDGIAGNPTIALVNDLAAIESLASTGFAVRISTDTWAQRTIAVTAPVSVSNGDGVSGNPTLSVSSSSNTATGVIQVAVYSETIAGSNNAKAITPLQLQKAVGVTLQGFDAATVKSNATKTLTVGYTASSPDLGTTTTGTWTPNPALGNLQLMRNGGTFTIAPPSADCTMVVYFYNSAPGAITFSGWHKVNGDTLDVTVGHAFFLFITSINGVKFLNIQRVL